MALRVYADDILLSSSTLDCFLHRQATPTTASTAKISRRTGTTTRAAKAVEGVDVGGPDLMQVKSAVRPIQKTNSTQCGSC
jgi:hypothetical protein